MRVTVLADASSDGERLRLAVWTRNSCTARSNAAEAMGAVAGVAAGTCCALAHSDSEDTTAIKRYAALKITPPETASS